MHVFSPPLRTGKNVFMSEEYLLHGTPPEKTGGYYIGIDGGGTQTRALLANQYGQIMGTGHTGSANPNHYSREQVRANLRQAICGVLGDRAGELPIASVFLGMGGVSTDADRAEVYSIVREIPEIVGPARVTVENDAVVGLTGGLSGKPGIVLIAGTGSACFGVNGSGDRWLCGGWGALADDVGSGPWIGLQALRAAVRAEDGRGRPTLLRAIAFDFLGIKEPRDFIRRVHNEGLDRASIGRLAPHVVEAYQQEDRVAREILQDAAAGLSEMVTVTARKLFVDSCCEMILVGGVALSGPPFQSLLSETIHSQNPNVSIRCAEMPPVHGAVLEALRADCIPWTPDVITNLSSSAKYP